MFITETNLRTRYAETDKMGYVYYGNYAQYYEVGRVEAFRSLGISYKELEEQGIIMPVLSLNIKFFKPAYYDELLTIKTSIREIPKLRVGFFYETYNEKGTLLNEGETTLVFVKKINNKPIAPPL